MSEVQYKMLPLPSVFMMEIDFPLEHVDTLNVFLDDLLLQEDRLTAADTLVGQIQQGEQLRIDHTHKDLEDVRAYLQSMAVHYVGQFFQHTGQNLDGDRHIDIDELWSVHSYAGDYNPIHDHGTKTIMGISCTTWTKVPEQIEKLNAPHMGEFSYYNASGCVDGFLEFVYGQSAVNDKERLKPTQAVVFKPEVGKIYFFPSWLQHMVYPFKGEGERRTVAANLNAFPVEKQ